MIDLALVQTFVLLSDLHSITAVSKKLGISAAAVSKQLSRLEGELGLQLLIRTTRRIDFTEMGINYCAQCRRILGEVDEASTLITQLKSEPQGKFKIVSGRHFAFAYIVPYLKEFLIRYPKIELDLELAERIPDLYAEAVDILIGMSISAIGDVIQRRIGTTSYVFCASPTYLKKFGTPKKPKDLEHQQYIAHSMRKPADEICFKHHKPFSVSPYIKVNDTQIMLDLALDGLGIIKVHNYVVKEDLEKGRLLELFTNYKKIDLPIYLAYPQRRFMSSKIRCFIDFILEKMALNITLRS